MTATATGFGPEFTPVIIKRLIIFTCAVSIGSALLELFFNSVLGMAGPEALFSLSWWGISKFYLWQPITYLFVYGSLGTPITLSWLIGLSLNMYMLWILGSYLLEISGTRSFLTLYFGAGITAGIGTLALMLLVGQYTAVYGPSAAILSLLVAWSMFNPESQILLFFILPIKAKWLVVGIIAALLLISLTSMQFASLSLYLFGIAFGYLYSVIGYNLQSPFPFTHPFETKLKQWFPRKSSKVIHLRDPSTMKDEQFVDAMLEKISRHGENSLTWWERQRMNKISRRSK